MLKKDRWVKRISYSLANSLALYKNESHEQKYQYYYSLQILLGTVIEIIFLVLIGYLLNMVFEIILCITVFASIRFFSGGFHQDTYKKCFITTLFIISAQVIISKYIYVYNSLYTNSITLLLSLFIIYKNSPCDTINKPISSKDRIIKFKILSVILTVFWSLISIYFINSNSILATCITIAVFSQALTTTNFIAGKAPIKQKNCASAQ